MKKASIHGLIVILCQIFNIMIVCKSDNFRAIALSSIFGKVLDRIILIKEQKSLCTYNLQIGFKEGVSTTQCTYVVNETISYYNFHKTNVHVLMLDAIKHLIG